MKKIFFMLAAVLLCANAQSQQLDESFEGTQFPPDGWISIDSDQYGKWKQTTKEGRVCACVQGSYGTENWLITPQLKPAAGEKLSFSARIGDYTSKGELRIEVSLAGTEASSFTVEDTYFTSQKAEESKRLWKTDWKEYTIDLSKYKGQRIFIAFHQAGEADKIYIDDVKGVTLAGSATCDVPANVEVSDITGDGATISWEGEAAAYQYLVLSEGEEADWSAAVKTTDKSVTLTNLAEETTFDFYVRAFCSEEEQSLAPKIRFKTTCEAASIPWLETFTRDATGDVAPECWTVASANPQVWVVADKTYDDEGNSTVVYGQAHLYAAGGGANSAQIFAMPAFDAQLNKMEVAFDYRTSMVSDSYGFLEVGYMSNPSDAKTFISLEVLPQTLEYKHIVQALNDLPADAKFIAFRFAGGSSDFGGLSMDNFVVAEIGKSGEVDPGEEEIPDPSIYGLTYCEAQFTWYAYTSEAFAIGLFDAESEQLVAGIVTTTGECDRFAYTDGVGFSEDDDYENHYYCSTKWIVNTDDSEGGLAKGDAWSKCVINVGTAVSPVLGLNPGKYVVVIYDYSTVNGQGAQLATIPFTLVDKKIENPAAAVAEDKKSATLTWDAPALSTGERLYVSVRSGETVAFDNYETKTKAVSPLTIEVVEGKSYKAYFQIIDKKNNPLGSEVQCDFTVGVNNYEPKNVHAEVFGGDNVTFTWEADVIADFYDIVLFLNGEYYTTLSVVGGTSKTTTMPKDGIWSWTVQAFTKGENDKYFPASNEIAGNDFESKAADIPEDAIVLNVAEFDAFLIDSESQYYQEGVNAWVLQFATGEEGAPGYPIPWFLVYTAQERAISGMYNVSRQNIDLESCLLNTDGKNFILGTDAEVRLQFDGYDEERMEQGLCNGYYTGSFRLVGEDGKTYVGKFMEMMCHSYTFSSYESGNILTHAGMWDEDPSWWQSIENIEVPETQVTTKILHEGALYIVRPNGEIFNMSGQRVK